MCLILSMKFADIMVQRGRITWMFTPPTGSGVLKMVNALFR